MGALLATSVVGWCRWSHRDKNVTTVKRTVEPCHLTESHREEAGQDSKLSTHPHLQA
jgi:hypothetical protein